MTGFSRLAHRLAAAMAALLPLAAVAADEAAADAAARLNAYLADVSTLQAEFRQVSLDDRGEVLAEWAGTLYLSRPGRFRWEYTEPYAQSVVADGARLWIFDSELEQATVKKLDGSLASNPAMLLSGTGDVEEAFDVRGSFAAGETTFVMLTPREQDTDFQSIRLGFEGEELTRMELVDSLDQTTRIEFSDVRRNADLDAAKFTFVVPAGVDVIGDDPLYEAAVDTVRDAGEVSEALLARRLEIDAQRAAGLISAMRENGLVVADADRGGLRLVERPSGD